MDRMMQTSNESVRGMAGRKTLLAAGLLSALVLIAIAYSVNKNRLEPALQSSSVAAQSKSAETTSDSLASGARPPKKKSGGAGKNDAATSVVIVGDRKQLRVRVVWAETGEGVAGTSLTIVQCSGNPGEIGGAAKTDSSGAALVTFPKAWTEIFVQVRHPQIAFQAPYVQCPPETETLIKVARGAAIFGKVFLEDKRPAAGAVVCPVNDAELATTADAQGAYEIIGLSKGYRQVVASLGGLISNSDGREPPFIDLKPGERSGPHDMFLKPGLVLSGFIHNQETGQSIAGAEIQRYNSANPENRMSAAAKSGADGAWRLEGLPAGRVAILAAAKGYASQQTMIQLIKGAKNACDLALEPGGDVMVTVVDQKGAPIAEAEVLSESDFSFSREGWSNPKTDAKGQARIADISVRNPPRIQASKENFSMRDAGPIPVFASGSRATELKIKLYAEQTPNLDESTSKVEKIVAFKGRVTNAEGSAIAGAKVYWGYKYNLESDDPASTGDDGAYRLEIKKEARSAKELRQVGHDHVLAVFAKGYSLGIKKQTEGGTAQEPLEVNFTLEKGHWAGGMVVSGKGDPLEGLEVRLVLSGKNDDYNVLFNRPDRCNIRTDAEGKFRFEDLSNRKALVQISGKGWTALSNKDIPLDQETRFVMKDGGVIKGRVVEAGTDAPVKSFTVKSCNSVLWEDSYGVGMLFNSGDGSFTLYDLQQGQSYSLVAQARGFIPEQQEELKATAESDAKPVDFKLSKGVETKGVVFDAATQKPIAGAKVSLYGDSEENGRHYFSDDASGGEAIHTLTDKQGAFSFMEGENPGAIAIKAEKYASLAIAPEDRVQYGGVHVLRIGLKTGGSVQGTVTFGGKPVDEANVSLSKNNRSWAASDIVIDDQSLQAQTDANGLYQIFGLSAGGYEMFVNKGDEKLSFNKSSRFRLADGEIKTLDISVEGGSAILFGRVLKGQTPIPEANISLSAQFKGAGLSRNASTDEKGEYRIEGLEEGKYSVSVYVSNPVPDSGSDNNLSEEIEIKGETRRDFNMADKHRVTMKIIFEGIPDSMKPPAIKYANLMKKELREEDTADKIDTNAYSHDISDNQLFFEGNFKGKYTLQINCEIAEGQGFSQQRPELLPLDNRKAEQDLGEIHIQYGGAGALKGFVLDISGKPLEGAQISLSSAGGEGAGAASYNASSNEQGHYEILGLRDGSYNAYITKSGGGRRRDNVSNDMQLSQKIEVKGATDHDFIMMANHKITVRFVLPSKPTQFRLSDLQSASLQLMNALSDTANDPLQISSNGYASVARGQAVFSGRFLGKYSLTVTIRDTTVKIPGTFPLDSMERDQNLGDITLPVMSSIRLQIALAPGAVEPPDSGQIMLIPETTAEGNTAPDSSETYSQVDLTMPDQEIGPFPDGRYRASLVVEGWKATPPLIPIALKPGEQADLSFALSPTTLLQGMIIMPEGLAPEAIPSRITVTGPGGSRTLVPVAEGDMSDEANLGKDIAIGNQFAFHDLQAGTWRLTVEAEGCQPASKDCVVKLGEAPITIQMKLKRK
ncbi:MAG: carboxypeptidase-like regulatory domain-containing protein [Candidatus Sumerlaeota bacterium]|nr:carboxypeptidase-like regulatory domain-containing protein [Candidatus Sumerlaeota bacterium]